MDIGTVAILSPGDMGHAVGQRLRENELEVVTCLAGRSDRTRTLAEKAGIRNVPTMEELVERSDLVMSMTVSAAVPGLCRQVADAIAATGADPCSPSATRSPPSWCGNWSRSSPARAGVSWTFRLSADRHARATVPTSTPRESRPPGLSR